MSTTEESLASTIGLVEKEQPKDLSVEVYPLESPVTIDEVADALRDGLAKVFKKIDVDVVDCPDLRQAPYLCSKPGLGSPGKGSVVDCGGCALLYPKVDITKEYDMRQIASIVDNYTHVGGGDEEAYPPSSAESTVAGSPTERSNSLPSHHTPQAFHILGAGACAYSVTGQNGELAINCADEGDPHTACGIVCEDSLPEKKNYHSYLSGPLCNVFKCSGAPGKVLRVHAAARMDPEVGSDIVETMKSILETAFPRDVLGLGGVVLVKKGKVMIHVMHDFTVKPIRSQKFIDSEWLRMKEADTPFTNYTVFVTNPPATLDLRPSHTHGFNDKVAGHYHYDTTPLRVDYECYLQLADNIYRVDRASQEPDFDMDVSSRESNTTAKPWTPEP
ncbi:hypothetical protein Pmar_PMAR027336 [Perkinsus marinus ATCC 50983]|uniref:DUF1907 domain-containing protein n=1 Tax=Perkinsus marinus (strain ATCC 50983 / TXsc) TaxID=423536 RepID=C5M1Q2_PERM5|nr:hypothetical protein Pmar_PMAR027336 [Perkinsus marinus ATCC 50983]EEQ97090.1 hypothetical protein Pmar_PMAR027336 [Perkinsus marinus ATCC 50983]|eukprot:XP_002764373.1 hypothetical protein Pmar_PMAR027336 [Perkinsus marinus ATCC 50983]